MRWDDRLIDIFLENARFVLISVLALLVLFYAWLGISALMQEEDVCPDGTVGYCGVCLKKDGRDE